MGWIASILRWWGNTTNRREEDTKVEWHCVKKGHECSIVEIPEDIVGLKCRYQKSQVFEWIDG